MDIKFQTPETSQIVFTVPEELNMTVAPRIKEKIKEILTKNNYKTIIFDLSGTDYIDSSGVGMLFYFAKQLKSEDKEMLIKKPQETVMKVFRLGNFQKVFNIID